MADLAQDWLAPLPQKLRDPLARCAAGLPPNVALMLLLMECAEASEAEDALSAAIARLEARGESVAAGRVAGALDLLRANPQAPQIVRSVLSGLDHQRGAAGAPDELAYWASAFDWAARRSPEASVALYSLGNADLLTNATAEVVERLSEWEMISPETECLDLGCGIGRFELALAPRVRRIVGIDIAAEMVAQARGRCAGLANVELRQTAGRDLSGFGDRSFGLVLAVDSFPYILQGGAALTQSMVAECARVLRPGGHLAILNFSYRGDIRLDRQELRAMAGRAGLEITRDGSSDLALWDGVTFALTKP